MRGEHAHLRPAHEMAGIVRCAWRERDLKSCLRRRTDGSSIQSNGR
jgi:hypothetical protein